MRVCLLASGSRGNAIYVESRESRILIDAGLSAAEIASRLTRIGAAADALDAILVTHEHLDHVRGLGPMTRRHRLPLYMHPATHRSLPRLGRVDRLCEFDIGAPFALRDLQVTAFPITHDAASPAGFVIDSPEGRIGVATDLGIATRLVEDCLGRCRVLILESNHDERMLQDGPYPWPLKQRIRSRHGHLSNSASAELLGRLAWPGLEAVFLAHLSDTNNEPEKALAAAEAILGRQNRCRPELVVGAQDRVSVCIDIE